MRKRQFKLSEQEVKALQGAYHNSDNLLARIRFQAVRLYGQGYRLEEIERICGCSRPSVLEWCRDYRCEGIAGLLDHRQGGNAAKLKPLQLEALQTLLEGYTPAQLFGQANCCGDGVFWTVPDLRRLVQERFGVLYRSDTSYRSLLAKCGLSLQRPGHYYKSRNERKVMAFEEECQERVLKS
jgi:transposase